MYGTIARMKVKPGKEAELMAQAQKEDELKIPGHIGEFIYRMDADPGTYYMAVLFESKESYVANADSPAQNERYEEMLSLLEGAPEWHDGEIVHAYPKLR
ncbi:MAG TPA: antibiotic biosynthesis monooxygenase family protein [Chloroflexia bacterium]|jgi:antibiotic biosynthesis monooxygenase (ABM) superfamily enzyme|nr:antibiotic biosynthesis monooxygenase family protein [Chloroflexia bacterium]